jgi:hypothetical protein
MSTWLEFYPWGIADRYDDLADISSTRSHCGPRSGGEQVPIPVNAQTAQHAEKVSTAASRIRNPQLGRAHPVKVVVRLAVNER